MVSIWHIHSAIPSNMKKIFDILESEGFSPASLVGETPYRYVNYDKDWIATVTVGGAVIFEGSMGFLFRSKQYFSIEQTAKDNFKDVFSDFLRTQ